MKVAEAMRERGALPLSEVDALTKGGITRRKTTAETTGAQSKTLQAVAKSLGLGGSMSADGKTGSKGKKNGTIHGQFEVHNPK